MPPQPQLFESQGHKNGMNIVELWSEDYIPFEKWPQNFTLLPLLR